MKATITGKVTAPKEGALPFAQVVLTDKDGNIIDGVGTSTIFSGDYSLEVPLMSIPNPATGIPMILPKGSHVEVRYQGYQPMRKPIPASKEINFRLQPSTTQLEDVVVTAQRIDTKPPVEDTKDRDRIRRIAFITFGGMVILGLALIVASQMEKK